MVFPDLTSSSPVLKTGNDDLKSRVNETLRKLVTEYKHDYSNKSKLNLHNNLQFAKSIFQSANGSFIVLGYFIYLFYFSCAHNGEQLDKIKNGVVFLKLLKDLNSEAKK